MLAENEIRLLNGASSRKLNGESFNIAQETAVVPLRLRLSYEVHTTRLLLFYSTGLAVGLRQKHFGRGGRLTKAPELRPFNSQSDLYKLQ